MKCTWPSRLTWLTSQKRLDSAAVAYGPDLQSPLEGYRDFWARFFRNFWRVQDLIKYVARNLGAG